ncbi:MAG: amidohydrolase family protein [Nitrospiraceae bacterium]|nr:amidohydrolase family protein [Nitrospiraceae bacterium]
MSGQSGLLAAGLDGKRLDDIEVVDVHQHYGRCFQFNMPHRDAADLLAEMDRIGIDKSIVSSFRALAGDPVPGNQEVLEVCRQHPDRFRMYFVVNPHYASRLDQLFAPFRESPFLAGLKIHAEIHQCPLASDAYRWAWRTAAELHCPALVHIYPPRDLEAVPVLADEYPDTNFLIAHHFGPENLDRALPLIEDKRNVHVDTCISALPLGTMERLVAELGPERVLFGTDMPYLNAGGQVGKVLLAQLDDETKKKILAGNAKRLFQHRL